MQVTLKRLLYVHHLRGVLSPQTFRDTWGICAVRMLQQRVRVWEAGGVKNTHVTINFRIQSTVRINPAHALRRIDPQLYRV
jgi:hypothetical protein